MLDPGSGYLTFIGLRRDEATVELMPLDPVTLNRPVAIYVNSAG
jgi:hypothetical protein